MSFSVEKNFYITFMQNHDLRNCGISTSPTEKNLCSSVLSSVKLKSLTEKCFTINIYLVYPLKHVDSINEIKTLL